MPLSDEYRKHSMVRAEAAVALRGLAAGMSVEKYKKHGDETHQIAAANELAAAQWAVAAELAEANEVIEFNREEFGIRDEATPR